MSLSVNPVETKTFICKDSNIRNPFAIPSDLDIFTLRDEEKQKKKIERVKQRGLKVHEKTTYSTQINARTKAMIRPAGDEEDDLSATVKSGEADSVEEENNNFVLATTKDRHVEKEHLDEYISKKREMFLVQYSLGVKRDEIRRLEEIAQAEEKKIEISEQYLEEDAARFDEFLRDNDKNAVEAIKVAEHETKAKLEKVSEIKKINAQMMAVKSETSRNEDLLKEYMLYKKFLDKLTPREIYETWAKRKIESKKNKVEQKVQVNQQKLKPLPVSEKGHRQSISKGSNKGRSSKLKQSIRKQSQMNPHLEQDGDVQSISSFETLSTISDDEDIEEDPNLFFDDPLQLLDMFSELEEQNLSLIQNSQDTEEALDEMKKNIQLTKEKMNRETDILKQQIEALKETTCKEEERAEKLEMKSKMYSYGEFKAEDQEKMLAQLNKKVEEVYRLCIGDNEANISTLQMLTNIENRLEELFVMIEMMPPEKVELAEKAKEKERRLRLREEKLLQQKKHQEERIQKAIERARAEPKKKTGRRLVFRSVPPQTIKQEDTSNEKQDKEEEDLKYFFT